MTYSLIASLARATACSAPASVASRRVCGRPSVCLSLLAFAACASPSYGNANLGEGGTSQSAADGTGSLRDAALPADGASSATSVRSSQPDAGAIESRPGVILTAGPSSADDGADAVDGGSSGVDSADAGGPTTPTLPSWAMPLIGPYAVLAYASKQDDFGTVTITEQIMKVEFVPHEGGLQLHSTRCRLSAENGVAEMLLVDPTSLAEQVSDVIFSETDQRWGTSPSTFPYGFTEDPPEMCKGKAGENVPRTQEQVWLSSTCRCPLPKQDPSIDDCRVVDPDHDRNPGVTYSLRYHTTTIGNVDLYSAGESGSFYKNGQIGADGKSATADVAASERAYQLDCYPKGCADIAGLGTYCLTSKNHAQFVRLDPSSAPAGGYTCADIVSRKASLFTLMTPSLATTTCP